VESAVTGWDTVLRGGRVIGARLVNDAFAVRDGGIVPAARPDARSARSLADQNSNSAKLS